MPDDPITVDVTDLMDAPEGTVRSGDEFHNPDNWVRCPSCRVGCPKESSTCFRCGAEIDDAAVREAR